MKQNIEQLKKEFKDRFCYGAYMETEAQSPEEYTNDIWNFFLPHLVRSHDEIKREAALSWEDFMWECFYGDNNTVGEDTSQHILDNLFDKWLEKQDLYELGLTFAERVRDFWETESVKNWYFEGDELVIKKGKWVIDHYQKHLTQSKEGGE